MRMAVEETRENRRDKRQKDRDPQELVAPAVQFIQTRKDSVMLLFVPRAERRKNVLLPCLKCTVDSIFNLTHVVTFHLYSQALQRQTFAKCACPMSHLHRPPERRADNLDEGTILNPFISLR